MKEFELYDTLDELDSESKYLVHKAKDATNYAYAPYSKFHVGAALLLEDGTLVIGSNQENASYPLSMCAERVAVYSTSTQYPGKKIQKIAVVAHKKTKKDLVPATLCGGCRQVLLEYEHKQKQAIELIMMGAKGKWIKCPSVASLLPFDFDKSNLL